VSPICAEKEKVCKAPGSETSNNSEGTNTDGNLASAVLYDECVFTYRDNIQQTHQTFDVKNLSLKIGMKATDHCIRIKTLGPASIDDAIKKHVEDCGNKAVRDSGFAAAISAAIAGGVSSVSGPAGAATFAVTAKQITVIAATSFTRCISDTDKITERLKEKMLDQFKSSVTDETTEATWDIVDMSGKAVEDFANNLFNHPEVAIEQAFGMPFESIERNLPEGMRESFKQIRQDIDREVKNFAHDVRKQGENIIGETATNAINKASEEANKVGNKVIEGAKKVVDDVIVKPFCNLFGC
jgi:hypothetical protein